MPKKHAHSGLNISPALSWENVPDGTESFVLIADDPDATAGLKTHWIVYNIPRSKQHLEDNINGLPTLPDGTCQGMNDFHHIGYTGPTVRPGRKAHRYFFRIYALDITLDLGPGTSRTELERLISGHILGKTKIMAHFSR